MLEMETQLAKLHEATINNENVVRNYWVVFLSLDQGALIKVGRLVPPVQPKVCSRRHFHRSVDGVEAAGHKALPLLATFAL